MARSDDTSKRSYKRWLLLSLVLVALVWVAFFDSHSLVKRYRWHQEHVQLAEENRSLRRAIDTLETRLAEPPSDELIEEIAREQYGMRRAGETVYRIEE